MSESLGLVRRPFYLIIKINILLGCWMEALATYESMMYGTEENNECIWDEKNKSEIEKEGQYNNNNSSYNRSNDSNHNNISTSSTTHQNNNNNNSSSNNNDNNDILRTYGSSSTQALQVRQKKYTVYGRDEPSVRGNFDKDENFNDVREGN